VISPFSPFFPPFDISAVAVVLSAKSVVDGIDVYAENQRRRKRQQRRGEIASYLLCRLLFPTAQTLNEEHKMERKREK
jgi:hypothetical protein